VNPSILLKRKALVRGFHRLLEQRYARYLAENALDNCRELADLVPLIVNR
jgi:hypothetical protein